MTANTVRSHFLVQLNGHYEGQATGETFNSGGGGQTSWFAWKKKYFHRRVQVLGAEEEIESVPEATRHFSQNREEAFSAIDLSL